MDTNEQRIRPSKNKGNSQNRVLKDGSEIRYDLPLYRQITEAPNTRIFSKAVQYLIESKLYKVFLPREVREEFVNDITEIYYRKFGYLSVMDDALTNSLAEYFLHSDVKVMPDYTVKRPDCNFFEYPFEGHRMRLRNHMSPYRFEVPVDTDFNEMLFNENLFSDSTPEDELSRVDETLDITQAFELADLTKLEKDIVWLNSVVGMSLRDIADLSDEFPSKSALSYKLKEAKDKLRKAVEKHQLK